MLSRVRLIGVSGRGSGAASTRPAERIGAQPSASRQPKGSPVNRHALAEAAPTSLPGTGRPTTAASATHGWPAISASTSLPR